MEVLLGRLGWDGCVIDASVTSDEVPQGRPHPDLILEAMKRTGVEDVASVMKVGDTPSDLLEGTAAGCGMVVGVVPAAPTRGPCLNLIRTPISSIRCEISPHSSCRPKFHNFQLFMKG